MDGMGWPVVAFCPCVGSGWMDVDGWGWMGGGGQNEENGRVCGQGV